MRYVPFEPAPSNRSSRATVFVRQATELDELIECAKLSAQYHGDDFKASLAQIQRHVTFPRNALYIACDIDESVIAYGRINWINVPKDAPENSCPAGYYLGGLVVDPAQRRRGIGDRLTIERLRFINQRAADVWYLVNENNLASIGLHDNHGFHESTRDFVFPGLVHDKPGGILQHRRLTPTATTCPGCDTKSTT